MMLDNSYDKGEKYKDYGYCSTSKKIKLKTAQYVCTNIMRKTIFTKFKSKYSDLHYKYISMVYGFIPVRFSKVDFSRNHIYCYKTISIKGAIGMKWCLKLLNIPLCWVLSSTYYPKFASVPKHTL